MHLQTRCTRVDSILEACAACELDIGRPSLARQLYSLPGRGALARDTADSAETPGARDDQVLTVLRTGAQSSWHLPRADARLSIKTSGLALCSRLLTF